MSMQAILRQLLKNHNKDFKQAENSDLRSALKGFQAMKDVVTSTNDVMVGRHVNTLTKKNRTPCEARFSGQLKANQLGTLPSTPLT